MGKARDEVMNITNNKSILKKMGLGITNNKARQWKEFNLLIGENGAGKSRLLKIIKENVSSECLVIHMDFTILNGTLCGEYKGEEYNELVNAVVFKGELDKAILRLFTENGSQQILNLFNGLLMMSNNQAFMKPKAEEIINKLNPSINKMMNRELKIMEGKICLKKGKYAKDINDEWNELSPGERSILVIIMAIFVITMMDKPSILLIDEMETHLHPLVQMEALRLLQKGIEGHDHCTCIASHSIFLLPSFLMDQIVYIDNGIIKNINGKLYQQIYNKLVGVDGEESLSDFLNSVASWQYMQYLSECFMEPKTVDLAQKDDVQACQLREILEKEYQNKKNINVLDFGAGSARIGKCIEMMLFDKDDTQIAEICQKINYSIYDKYETDKEFLSKHKWCGKAYKSRDEVQADGGKFDVIVLFNVLHEIGIDEWEEEINFIFSLLADDGLVLFGERRILTIGEKPYGKSGYLVLEEEELAKLLPSLYRKKILLPDDMNEVTICYMLKKQDDVKRVVMKENIVEALAVLEKNSRTKIREIRKALSGKIKAFESRKYAFFCQQYVNAQEALEILHEIDNKTNLEDILQSTLPWGEKKKQIIKLAQENTEEGLKCQKYLEAL